MEITIEYITSLKNSYYKILCLFEESNCGLTQYIDSLIYEMEGLEYLIEKKQIKTITTLISILEHFYDDSLQAKPDLSVIRREVFHCLNLIDKTFGIEVGDE